MFQLNRLTDYAVVVMSQMSGSGVGLRSAQQIARDTFVPLPTVGKVLNVLTREGLVDSHRGASGGYALSRTADEITVAEIICSLEGPIALTGCEVESPYPMCGTWDRVNDVIHQALSQVTLADLIAQQPSRVPSFTHETAAQVAGT